MKKHALLFLTSCLLLSFAGCSEKKPDAADDPITIEAPAESADTDGSEDQPEKGSVDTAQASEDQGKQAEQPEVSDVLSLYAPVLNETCNLIYNGFHEDDRFEYVSSGVMDMANMVEKDELLNILGYNIEDINNDGIPELMIGTIPDEKDEVSGTGEILGGYTMIGDDIVKFLEGWARSSYQWLGGNRFYYFGSGGAAYSAFGTFHLDPGKSELTCEDFYFTDTEGDNFDVIIPYHNTTGQWDTEVSQKSDMNEEELWKLCDDMRAGCMEMEMTPLKSYPFP